jgi:toxin ParE1/3/4
VKLIFSLVFETDFSSGVEYLAREASEEIARRWENAAYGTITQLQKHPSLGRLRRDLHPPGIRTFSVKYFPRHLIFYIARENELVLLRVKHGAMNLHALFAT